MSLATRIAVELPDRVHPRLLGPIGSVLVTLARGERCVVRRRHDAWVHSYRTGTVVQTTLGGASARIQDADTLDLFLFGYVPRPGDTVFDLGAGVGGEVRLLSRLVGAFGRVISVEAHPRVFRCLRQVVELNRLDNVTAVQCAVTGAAGPVWIEDDAAHLSNSITSDRSGLEVPGETLSGLAGRLGVTRIDLLKLNIEGAELPVLESSLDLLPAVRNIVVSCHDFKADRGGPEWQRTYGPVRALLTAAGYRIRNRPDDPRPWVPYYLYATR